MHALTPLKKYKVKVIGAPLLKIFECVCELYIPFIVKDIIDEGFNVNSSYYLDTQFIVLRVLLMFGLAFAGFFCTMLTQYLSSKTCSDYNYDLRKLLFSHLQKLSIVQVEEYGKNKALNLVSNDSLSMQRGVQMYMRLLLRAPFLVVGSVVASFLVSTKLGFVVLGALVLSSIVIGIIFVVTPKRYGLAQKELDNISSIGEDNVEGSRVIRAFNQQENQKIKFNKSNEEYERRSINIERINSLVNPLTFAFVNGAIILIFFLGNISIKNNDSSITIGGLVSLVSYLTQALTALLQFTKLVTSLSKAFSSKKRIDEFLAIEPKIISGEVNKADQINNGDELIKFDNVCLNFGGEVNALDQLSFSVRKGEKVGIIGGTGSGKSILLSLLNRNNEVTSGQVIFAHKNVKEYDLGFLKSHFAYVSQTPSFFAGTINDNLTLGEEYSEREIIEALQLSQAFEFVSKYSDFIERKVEEAGSNFSGGQKQRLLIARAILANKEVLVLDDATSALDYKTDSLIRNKLNEKKDLTLFIASQRATSLIHCDNIIVLDKGVIVGYGDHDYLLNNCDVYKEIYETQVKING